MRILHQVLKKMYQESAVVFPPAKYAEIHMVNTILTHSGLAPLPQDYIDFLTLTDGLFFNGLELFATREHEREKGAFFHRGITQMQRTYADNPTISGKIILAQAPEELIFYDFKKKEYQIVDRYNYSVFLKFPHFLDVLYYYVRIIIEK